MSNANWTTYAPGMTWYSVLSDPLGVTVDTHQIPFSCQATSVPWWDVFHLTAQNYCEVSGSGQYFVNHPPQNWTNGTYTVKLYEHIFNTPYILSSDTVNVMNASGYLGIITQTPIGINTPIKTPDEVQTEMTALLTSSFFWALILTVGLMIAAGIETGKNMNPIIPMVVVGFLSICGFTLIGWIPAWITFSMILLLVVIFAWQRAKDMNTAGE